MTSREPSPEPSTRGAVVVSRQQWHDINRGAMRALFVTHPDDFKAGEVLRLTMDAGDELPYLMVRVTHVEAVVLDNVVDNEDGLTVGVVSINKGLGWNDGE